VEKGGVSSSGRVGNSKAGCPRVGFPETWAKSERVEMIRPDRQRTTLPLELKSRGAELARQEKLK